MFEGSQFAGGQFETGGSRGPSAPNRIGAAIVAVVMLLGGASCIALYFLAAPSAELSSYTQAHGVRRTAVIQQVENIPEVHGSKHQETTISYTAQVQVGLTSPVGGQTQTWVQCPDTKAKALVPALPCSSTPNSPATPNCPAHQPTPPPPKP